MRVAVYTRVSTEGQLGPDKYGIRSQKADINRLLRQKRWDIAAEYTDTMSGMRADRPGLQEMLAAAHRHEFDAVVIARNDRLARSVIIALLTRQELEKLGIHIISVAEPTNENDDDTTKLINTVTGAVAEYDHSKIKKRMTGGRLAKATMGEYAGGRPIFGYDHVNKQLKMNPGQAAIVQEIFTLRNERWTMQAIATKLNEEKRLTRKGALWCSSQICRILQHKAFYRGRYRYSTVTAKGKQETILT